MQLKRMHLFLSAALLAAAACAPLTAAAAIKQEQPPAESSTAPANFKISFSFRVEGVEASGNMVALNASKVSYQKALVPQKNGKKGRKEAPKYGTVVECLPVQLPGTAGLVKMSCLFQMSAPKPGKKSERETAVQFDLNTDFTATPGQPMLLVDEPDKRIEITVERAP